MGSRSHVPPWPLGLVGVLDGADVVQHTVFKQRRRGHLPQLGQRRGTGHQRRVHKTYGYPLPTACVSIRLNPGERWPHIGLPVGNNLGGRARKYTCHRVPSPRSPSKPPLLTRTSIRRTPPRQQGQERQAIPTSLLWSRRSAGASSVSCANWATWSRALMLPWRRAMIPWSKKRLNSPALWRLGKGDVLARALATRANARC